MNKPKFQLRSPVFELVRSPPAGHYRKAAKTALTKGEVLTLITSMGWSLCHWCHGNPRHHVTMLLLSTYHASFTLFSCRELFLWQWLPALSNSTGSFQQFKLVACTLIFQCLAICKTFFPTTWRAGVLIYFWSKLTNPITTRAGEAEEDNY